MAWSCVELIDLKIDKKDTGKLSGNVKIVYVLLCHFSWQMYNLYTLSFSKTLLFHSIKFYFICDYHFTIVPFPFHCLWLLTSPPPTPLTSSASIFSFTYFLLLFIPFMFLEIVRKNLNFFPQPIKVEVIIFFYLLNDVSKMWIVCLECFLFCF